MIDTNHAPRTYYGCTIWRTWPSGYWEAFVSGHGTCYADTLAGIKRLIRERVQ